MINKALVRDRFSKNLKNYNENAKIQKHMAEKLVSLIKNKNPRKILELGCGTGFLTNLVNQNLSFEEYIAIDIVESCNVYINEISPKIEFLAKDIEDYIELNSEKFDLIISNASLQWVENFERVIKTLENKLNPNGELIFSTFGNENFREIYHILGTSLRYFSNTELHNIFPNAEIEPEIHIMAFDSPKDVLKHLQLTGVNAIENTSWTKKDLTKFENGYKNICSKKMTLTYNPIYIRIISPVG